MKKMFAKLKPRLTRRNVFTAILSLLGAAALTYGSLHLAGRSLHSLNFAALLNFCIYFAVLLLINQKLFQYLDRQPKVQEQRLPARPLKLKWFLLIWGTILLCWVPVFLAYYPGIWAYDTYSQLQYDMTDHPLIHTALLRLGVLIGECVHNYNFGIAVYTLIQMIILSGIFAFTVCKLATWRFSRKLCGLMAGFFAIMPFNSMLAISATKDVLFGGFFLLTVVLLYDLFYRLKTDTKFSLKQHKFLIISLVLAMTAFILFRKNALYVVAIWLIISVIVMPRIFKRQVFCITLGSILLATGIQAGLTQLYQATSILKHEALAIPMQNLIVTAANHPEIIPEYGNHELLFGIIDRDLFPEEMSETIAPHIVDPVKLRWQRAPEVTTEQILSAWIKYGVQYPLDYLDSWAVITVSAWSPINNDYARVYGGTAVGYLETNFMYHPKIGDAHPNSKFPWLQSLLNYEFRDNHYADNPITFLLLAPALYAWILVFCFAYAWYRRARLQTAMLLMPILLFGTVLLAPCILVRYMYPPMITAPIFLMVNFLPSSLSIFAPSSPRSDS